MPFAEAKDVFKCVMCPCCFEGFACSPFANCCAIRVDALVAVDPCGTKNCWVDTRTQQCCVNVFTACPANGEKVPLGCGCCNMMCLPCPMALCGPSSCCTAPDDASFPDAATTAVCKTHCYCCVSGYYCKPDCCAAKVKANVNLAPLTKEEFVFDFVQQQCCSIMACAYPLNQNIPKAIGCCDIICWSAASAHTPVADSESSVQVTENQVATTTA